MVLAEDAHGTFCVRLHQLAVGGAISSKDQTLSRDVSN